MPQRRVVMSLPPLQPRFDVERPEDWEPTAEVDPGFWDLKRWLNTAKRGANTLADLWSGSTAEEQAQSGIAEIMGGVGPIGTVLTRGMTRPVYQAAVRNTPSALLERAPFEIQNQGVRDDILRILMQRRQVPEAAGSEAIRGGVFFTPAKSPDLRYFTGKGGYGGSELVEAPGEFVNPLIARGGTGGTPTRRGYEYLAGKGSLSNLESAASDIQGWQVGPNRSYPATPSSIADLLSTYGGSPELASTIWHTAHPQQIRSVGGNVVNQLVTSLVENIAAQRAKREGIDAIVGITRRKGQPAISEIFDLTRTENPTNVIRSYRPHTPGYSAITDADVQRLKARLR